MATKERLKINAKERAVLDAAEKFVRDKGFVVCGGPQWAKNPILCHFFCAAFRIDPPQGQDEQVFVRVGWSEASSAVGLSIYGPGIEGGKFFTCLWDVPIPR